MCLHLDGSKVPCLPAIDAVPGIYIGPNQGTWLYFLSQTVTLINFLLQECSEAVYRYSIAALGIPVKVFRDGIPSISGHYTYAFHYCPRPMILPNGHFTWW